MSKKKTNQGLRVSSIVPPDKFEKIFERADKSSFDYVINLASETKLSQPAEVNLSLPLPPPR